MKIITTSRTSLDVTLPEGVFITTGQYDFDRHETTYTIHIDGEQPEQVQARLGDLIARIARLGDT
jgi:hypothetical protein